MRLNFKSRYTLSVLFITAGLLLFSSCEKELPTEKALEEFLSTGTQLPPPPGVDYIMFQDNEDPEALYNHKDRSFHTNEVLQLRLYKDDSLRLSFYCPKTIKNVVILAKISKVKEPIIIFELEEVKGFQRAYFRLPFTEGKKTYQTSSGKTVEIDLIESFTTNDIEFSVYCKDSLYKKLSEIKANRNFYFNKGISSGNYYKLRPVHARELITYYINFTYMLSHPHFKDAFINFSEYEGLGKVKARLNGNSTGEDFLTPLEIQRAYDGFLDNREITPGLVADGTMAEGLGGGTIVASRETYLLTQFTPTVYYAMVIPHEWGHHCGWNHDSNFTYGGSNGGVAEMMLRCLDYLFYTKQAPLWEVEEFSNWDNNNLYNVYKEPVYKPFPIDDNWFFRKYNISVPYEFGKQEVDKKAQPEECFVCQHVE